MTDAISPYNVKLVQIGFVSLHLFDVADIFIVAFAGYRFYAHIRGTVAAQIFSGLVVLVIAFFVASVLDLTASKWLVTQFVNVWIVVVIILFQPEIRRVLIFLGASPFVRRFLPSDNDKLFDELINALRVLKNMKLGALIVVARGTGLKAHSETGTSINAEISSQLLISIFNKNSPLHDGAVVVHDYRIVAARCLLPLTSNQAESYAFGTRHRAAIGITEISDSISIVLSEETGRLSFCKNGKIYTDTSFDELKAAVRDHLARSRLSLFK